MTQRSSQEILLLVRVSARTGIQDSLITNFINLYHAILPNANNFCLLPLMLFKFILSFISKRVLTLRTCRTNRLSQLGRALRQQVVNPFTWAVLSLLRLCEHPRLYHQLMAHRISDLWLRGSFIKTINYTRVKKKKAILINIITTLKLDFLSKIKNSTRTTVWLLKWMHKLLRADLSIK